MIHNYIDGSGTRKDLKIYLSVPLKDFFQTLVFWILTPPLYCTDIFSNAYDYPQVVLFSLLKVLVFTQKLLKDRGQWTVVYSRVVMLRFKNMQVIIQIRYLFLETNMDFSQWKVHNRISKNKVLSSPSLCWWGQVENHWHKPKSKNNLISKSTPPRPPHWKVSEIQSLEMNL